MSSRDKTRILIVDDLPEKLVVYKVILEELEQEIVTARSGSEALKQVLQHDFAVILLDVNMPDMDGFETAALIRQRKRSAHTPIIFITSFADEWRATEGYARGAVDYILAPVVPEILRAKVKVFVDLFRLQEQVKRQAAEQIALAEERMRRTAAEEANCRLSFLSRAGVVLGQSLDFQLTACGVVKLSVPTLADIAMIVPAERPDGKNAAVQARFEGGETLLEPVEGLSGLSDELCSAIHRALATGAEEALPGPPVHGQTAAPRQIVLPLRTREESLAALVLSRVPSGRTFSQADRTMAEALISRAAIALENARLYRDLEQADRQKDEFLSMLAHELRNPLAPIRSAVAVLRRFAEDGSDARRAHDVIDRQVSHLARLVDDLLDVSRITRGKIDMKMATLDVATVIDTAVETSRPQLEALSHELHVQLPDAPLFVNADHARLAQILSNLLNNAAKFTPRGGTIWLSALSEGDEAVFRVRDTGIGIPPEMLERVFDLFTQVEQSLDRAQGGLGIGLTVVQRLVELHGGRVEAASAGIGCGSEFTVRLPAVAAAALPAEPEESPSATDAARQGLRVLVVDDNADAAESLAWLLRLSGHQTRVAYDGPSAIEAALLFQPQALILDLGLPGLDGYRVAQHLRQEPAVHSALFIALSGYGREVDQRRSSEAGFDHHLIKPVDVNTLLEILSAATPDDAPRTAVSAAGE
jgi:signal transduction histidine kinase